MIAILMESHSLTEILRFLRTILYNNGLKLKVIEVSHLFDDINDGFFTLFDHIKNGIITKVI